MEGRDQRGREFEESEGGEEGGRELGVRGGGDFTPY